MPFFVPGMPRCRWAFLALLILLLAAPVQAQDGGDTEPDPDEAGEGEPEYVELFDPDQEDPQEPPEQPIPELPFADDEFVDDSTELEPTADSRRPWDPEPKRVPSRVLAPGDSRDPRSVELFYYGCTGERYRRDLTLFANGTIRLRRGPTDEQEMRLEEVGPVELRRHLGRLLRIRAHRDFPSQLGLGSSVEGSGVDVCRFGLDLPGFDAVRLDTGSFDVLPLPLRQLEQFADDLAELTRPLVRPETLNANYEPEIGDVLRTADGVAYRVLGFTTDGGAVELESLDGNWRIFVPEDEFLDFFAVLDPVLGRPDPGRPDPGRPDPGSPDRRTPEIR